MKQLRLKAKLSHSNSACCYMDFDHGAQENIIFKFSSGHWPINPFLSFAQMVFSFIIVGPYRIDSSGANRWSHFWGIMKSTDNFSLFEVILWNVLQQKVFSIGLYRIWDVLLKPDNWHRWIGAIAVLNGEPSRKKQIILRKNEPFMKQYCHIFPVICRSEIVMLFLWRPATFEDSGFFLSITMSYDWTVSYVANPCASMNMYMYACKHVSILANAKVGWRLFISYYQPSWLFHSLPFLLGLHGSSVTFITVLNCRLIASFLLLGIRTDRPSE